MTAEERNIIDKLKREEIIEQQKKDGIDRQRNWRYKAKCELLWEKEGAAEKHFDQLHDWVKNEFSNDYEKYYAIYNRDNCDNFPSRNEHDRIERRRYFNSVPIEEQLNISWDEWNKDLMTTKRSNRQLGWAVAIVLGIGVLLFKSCGFL